MKENLNLLIIFNKIMIKTKMKKIKKNKWLISFRPNSLKVLFLKSFKIILKFYKFILLDKIKSYSK